MSLVFFESQQMKQLIQSYRTGELWLAEVPAPAVKGRGLLVQTAVSLVSAGTERMIIELAKKSLLGKARARPDLVKKVIAKIKTEGLSQTLQKVFSKLETPIPLGYSCAGAVVEVGPEVSGWHPGDRVACGGAGYATHAEYNYVPKNLCVKIPDGVSFAEASFTTLGAIAMQGVRQADVRLGERVVVIGLGLLGLLTVQILKAGGCKVLGSDPNAQRCELAKELGADDAVAGNLAATAAGFSDGYGADAVIIAAATTSNQPVEIAAEVSRVKGRVVVVGMVGMNVPRDPFYKKELELKLSMSYGPGRYDPSYEESGHDYPFGHVRWTEQRNMQSFVDLVAAGKVTPSKLITHRFEIDDALGAYELLGGNGGDGKPEKYLGIVITYPTIKPEQRVVGAVKLKPLIPTETIGVGFIGAGNFTRGVLLPALKRVGNVDLVGICAAEGMDAAETGKKHGFSYASSDYEDIVRDERINVVLVTTRHDTHARFACAALAAGKNVFLEKPLCIRPEELAQYEDTFKARGEGNVGRLMVGYNRRFSPHAKAMREAFESRQTPMVVNYRVNAGFVPKDVWLQDPEVGGGRIIGEVCHVVDLCEYLIGSVPVRVYAECIASDASNITPEDSVVITIRYADGSLAVIQYLAHGAPELAKERIEVFADGAAAISNDFSRTTFYGPKRPPVKGKQQKGFEAELSEFFAAIRDGRESPIPVESLMRTTRVTFAAVDSLRCGKAVPLAF